MQSHNYIRYRVSEGNGGVMIVERKGQICEKLCLVDVSD